MAVLKNRAKMSTSATGTSSPITLGSAEDGYQSFADAGVANADVVRYVIEDGNNFEIGTGTYTSSGTTLSRTVSESSNSNNAINLSGSATVFIGATAEDIELSGNMAGDILSNGHAIKLGDRSSSDVNELIMGAGGDFRLYHNGSTGHSLITETGSGNLQIAATNIELKAASGHALLTATYGGSVDLYYNSSKKAETTSSGLQTTGTLNVNGAYTLPTSDGTANQVLTTDGSGVVTFADAGGGDPDLYRDNASSATTPVASGANAVAIGTQAEASGTSSIALGFDAVASAALAFAASDGTASGVSSIAIGESAVAGTASSTIAIGRNTDATGTDALAIGSNAQSTGSESVALGQSLASGNGSFAAVIDNNTSTYGATGANSIAMGYRAKASHSNSTSIGRNSSATNSDAVALGNNATASGSGGLALGINPTASGSNSVAIGDAAVASTIDALAIGSDTDATGFYTVALGQGAQANIGDGAVAIGKSRASGNYSFAAAIANNTSSYGASQTSTIAIGYQAKAPSIYSVAIGAANVAEAGRSLAIGGYGNVVGGTGSYSVICGGRENETANSYSFASGAYAKADIEGKLARASGRFAATGDAQGGQFILRADTTDATATVLTTNNSTAGSTNQIVAANDTCIMFSGTLVAMQNGAQDQGGWEIKGLLKNDGGTTTLVSSNIQTFDDGNGWTVALSADNTNNALAITCTGEAAHNIRWVANIQTSEVTYA